MQWWGTGDPQGVYTGRFSCEAAWEGTAGDHKGPPNPAPPPSPLRTDDEALQKPTRESPQGVFLQVMWLDEDGQSTSGRNGDI